VTATEKAVGQRYAVNISVSVDTSSAGRSDDLKDTVNYAHLYEVVVATLEAGFNLLERPANLIAETILRDTRAQSVTVSVRKLLPPLNGVVAASGVEVTRTRDHAPV
jgi:dihydroneopterin aldolase